MEGQPVLGADLNCSEIEGVHRPSLCDQTIHHGAARDRCTAGFVRPRPPRMQPVWPLAFGERSSNRVVRTDDEGPLPTGFVRGPFWIDYQVEIT